MAGPTVGYATLQIIPSLKGVQKTLSNELTGAGGVAGEAASRSFGERFSAGLKTAAKVGAIAFTAALGGAIVVGKQAIDSASTLEQAIGKVDAVFGDSADEIRDWARTAATAFGQSESQALAAAGTYGNLFQAFGIGQKPAQEMSQTLVELAADLAAFNDTTVDEALLALRSGLSGETEPLKRFGVALNDARLKQVALEMGIWDGTGALDAAQKAQAAYNLILQDTTIAQGAFSRESDSLSARQMVLAAQWENMKASIGQALIPAMSAAVGFIAGSLIPRLQELAEKYGPAVQTAFQSIADWAEANWPKVRDAIAEAVDWFKDEAWPIIKETAGFILDRFGELVGWVQTNWPKIRETIAGVIEAVRVIIETATAAIREIWSRWGNEITAIVSNAWDTVKAVVQSAIEVVRGVINTVTALIRGDWDAAWEGIKTALSGVLDGIIAIVTGFLGNLKILLSLAWDGIKAAAAAAWDGIKAAITGAWDELVAFAASIPGRMLDALGDMAQWGADLVAAIVAGIKSAAHQITDAIKDAVPSPGDLVGGVVGGLKGLGKKVIPGLATGGFAGIGSTVMVGEDGPELMQVTARGAYVTDSRTTRMMLNSGNAGGRSAPLVSVGEQHIHNEADAAAFWQQANAYLTLV